MIRKTTAALLLPLLALGACKDTAGTSAPGRMDLVLAADPSTPVFSTHDGSTGIECDVLLSVRGDGDAGMTAVFTGMMFRFHVGSIESPAVDSVLLSASEAGDAFGGGRFRPREARQATFRLTAGAPFLLGVEVRYRTSAAEDGAARAEYRCGIDPATDAPLPEIRVTPLATNPAEPEPGDRLEYDLVVESRIGLWDGDVRLHGAMDSTFRWAGGGALVYRDTVIVDVPSVARLGEAIRFSTSARDIVLRRSESAAPASGIIVDRTQPLMGGVGVHGLGNPQPRGQLPEDDPSPLVLWASDNGLVKWVVFSGGTPGRDSIPYVADSRYPLPVARLRAGDLRVEVRDAAGNLSEPVIVPAGSILFYPRRTARHRRVPLPEFFGQAAYGAGDERVYLLGAGGNRIYVVSLEAAQLEATLVLEHAAAAIDVSDDGAHLVVARSDGSALDLIDLSAPQQRRSIPLTPRSSHPGTMSAGAGRKAFLLARDSLTQVVEVDLEGGAERVVAESGGLHNLAIDRSGDYRRLVIAGQCLFDPITTVLDCRPDASGMPVTGDHAGTRWTYSMAVYDEALRRIPLRVSDDLPFQPFSALSPDGRYLFTSTATGLARARTVDGLVEEGFLPAPSGTEDLRVLAGGRRVVLYEAGMLSIYDLP